MGFQYCFSLCSLWSLCLIFLSNLRHFTDYRFDAIALPVFMLCATLAMLYDRANRRLGRDQAGNASLKTKRVSILFGRLLYGLLAGLLLGIAALAIFLIYDRRREPKPVNTGPFAVEGAAAFDGILAIDPPVDLPPFVLTDSKGRSVRLADLRGGHTLLTFGFTHCPDICPLTLNDFARIRRLLGDLTEHITFVFVSVDGKRDTPEALRQYFEFRQLHDISALTGDEASVRALGQPFGLAFEISDEGRSGGYLINHTTGAFLLDPAGRWIKRYQFGVPPDTIAAELRTLLKR